MSSTARQAASAKVGALFRRANPERQSIDVNDLVIEALQVIAKELADCSITVDTQLTSELPRIMGHKGQLQEVILNLVQNSIDAMRTVTAKPRMLHVRTEPHAGASSDPHLKPPSG